MEDGHGGLGLLRGVEEAEGVAAEGIHDGVEVDLPDPLEAVDVEGVLAKELAGASALDVTLAELWVLPLEEGHLLLRELGTLLGDVPLEAKPAVVVGAEPLLAQEVLDGRGADGDALQLELVAEACGHNCARPFCGWRSRPRRGRRRGGAFGHVNATSTTTRPARTALNEDERRVGRGVLRLHDT